MSPTSFQHQQIGVKKLMKLLNFIFSTVSQKLFAVESSDTHTQTTNNLSVLPPNSLSLQFKGCLTVSHHLKLQAEETLGILTSQSQSNIYFKIITECLFI